MEVHAVALGSRLRGNDASVRQCGFVLGAKAAQHFSWKMYRTCD